MKWVPGGPAPAHPISAGLPVAANLDASDVRWAATPALPPPDLARYTEVMWPRIPEDLDDKDAWRKAYRATTDALERIRAQELAAMTDEDAVREIKSLRLFGQAWRERPDGSGLVEQQAILQGFRGA